ncbi:hypothetical protein BLNAU_16253 [Blattamonas nauphoetae]|uniref:B30.2/SPRY domain-containing protein n=1 Tax=Blattamonas nauphoetae TaxID=2049346 RepID=A0ABQ9X8F5_9EUKA|nr:hypothetical protein BLNAU_16253 [Blattamonas nauphoetae]
MLSNPDNSSTTIATTDGSAIKPNEDKKELFAKLKKLETESDEIRVGIAKELVNLCLDDSGNSKGIGTTLMEGRILPILGNQLSLPLSVEVRVGFQVLFDAVLAVISKNEGVSLSKHFPSLLTLSRDSNSRISEPVIATIGLITHRLSSPSEVELFLQSGILESLVWSLRTHRDARVRKAIVVALGEIGVGLKLAVVRAEASKDCEVEEWRRRGGREKKQEELGGERSFGDESESEDENENEVLSFAKPVWSVSLSGWEVEALGRVGWEREDRGETDFGSRCRRGVGIVREGLIGVIRGWGKEKRELEEGQKKGKDEKDGKEMKEGKEEQKGKEVIEGEEEWREEEDVGVRRVAGSVCGVVFGEVFGVSESWCVSGGVVGVRGSDMEAVRVEMKKKMEEQQATFESQLRQAEDEARKREEEMKKENEEIMKKEKEEMQSKEREMMKEKEEMEALIAELRKNQRPALISISEIKAVLSNTSKLSRSGDTFTFSSGGCSTVTLDHTLTKGIWLLTLRIIQQSGCFQIGFLDSTEGPFPDSQWLGQFNTSLSFCPQCTANRKCHIGQSYTEHGKGSVSFKTGDEVVLEVDMEARTCHLFVNSVQTKVFARGIPASVKLAVTFDGSNNGFEVKSFR